MKLFNVSVLLIAFSSFFKMHLVSDTFLGFGIVQLHNNLHLVVIL